MFKETFLQRVIVSAFAFLFVATVGFENRTSNAGLIDPPWQMFRRDLRHTGVSPYKGAQANTLKWSFKVEKRITSSPAIGLDDTIYFGSVDGKLYAVSPEGKLKWSFQTGDEVTSSPAIGYDGTIYFGSRDKKPANF